MYLGNLESELTENAVDCSALCGVLYSTTVWPAAQECSAVEVLATLYGSHDIQTKPNLHRISVLRDVDAS